MKTIYFKRELAKKVQPFWAKAGPKEKAESEFNKLGSATLQKYANILYSVFLVVASLCRWVGRDIVSSEKINI